MDKDGQMLVDMQYALSLCWDDLFSHRIEMFSQNINGGKNLIEFWVDMKWRCWILKLEKMPKFWLASFHSAILKFKQVLYNWTQCQWIEFPKSVATCSEKFWKIRWRLWRMKCLKIIKVFPLKKKPINVKINNTHNFLCR